MSRYKLGYNVIYLLCSKAAYIAASFALYIVLVRAFDRYEINIFGLAIAFNNLFIVVVDFGVTHVIIRLSASYTRENLLSVFLSGIAVKCIYVLFWYAILYVGVYIMYQDDLTQKAIYIGCLSALVRSFSEYIDGISTGIGRSELAAVFNVIQYFLIFSLCTIIGYFLKWGLMPVLYCYCFVMSFSFVMRLLWILKYVGMKSKIIKIISLLKELIYESPKFGISLITLALTGSNLCLIIISLIDSTKTDLAIFQGAQKIIGLTIIFGGVIGQSLYAAASNAIAKKNEEELYSYMQRSLHLLTVLSFGSMVFFSIMGQYIVNLLYAGRLEGTAGLLFIISIGLPLGLLIQIPYVNLAAAKKQGITMVIVLTIGLISIPVVYYSTEIWKLQGTAFAYVIMLSIQCIILIFAQKIVLGHLPNFIELWKIILASGAMGILLYLMRESSFPTILTGLIGTVSYLIILILFKEDEILFGPYMPAIKHKFRSIR